jgi:hypothetical protein
MSELLVADALYATRVTTGFASAIVNVAKSQAQLFANGVWIIQDTRGLLNPMSMQAIDAGLDYLQSNALYQLKVIPLDPSKPICEDNMSIHGVLLKNNFVVNDDRPAIPLPARVALRYEQMMLGLVGTVECRDLYPDVFWPNDVSWFVLNEAGHPVSPVTMRAMDAALVTPDAPAAGSEEAIALARASKVVLDSRMKQCRRDASVISHIKGTLSGDAFTVLFGIGGLPVLDGLSAAVIVMLHNQLSLLHPTPTQADRFIRLQYGSVQGETSLGLLSFTFLSPAYLAPLFNRGDFAQVFDNFAQCMEAVFGFHAADALLVLFRLVSKALTFRSEVPESSAIGLVGAVDIINTFLYDVGHDSVLRTLSGDTRWRTSLENITESVAWKEAVRVQHIALQNVIAASVFTAMSKKWGGAVLTECPTPPPDMGVPDDQFPVPLIQT